MIAHASRPAALGGTLGGEWTACNLVQITSGWLGEELGAKRMARWHAALGAHLELLKLTANYIATAPNHFIWRAALLCACQ